MKKSLHLNFIITIIICSVKFAFSQQVTIDNSIPLQQLIENNLTDGCVEISNVSSSVNGSADGFPSYGAFQQAGSSFPLSDGIVLSTGNANSGGNAVNSNDLSEGSTNWGTDPDIETFLGINNTLNATSIEFDFISFSNSIQFNYLFASEEYFGNFPCFAQDGFVFLIRETTSTGPYQNIALVAGSNDTVIVNNIHDAILNQCPAENDTYFDGFINDTNYNGRTTMLTASANIIPNTQYHVKLIIADQEYTTYDSAVFIEANSFNDLDLGEDVSTCSASVTLNGDIQNPLASYTWFRDGNVIAGENNPTLNATLTGLYRVEIAINGNSCTIDDEVFVTIDTELTTSPISSYFLCETDGDGIETFDLSTKTTDVLNAIQNLPANYTLSYHYSDADARNNIGSITAPIQNTLGNPQTIFVRVEDTNMGCLIFGTFDLIVNSPPSITQPSSISECDNDTTPDNITLIDLNATTNEITAGDPNLTVTYHYTPLGADTGTNFVPIPYYNTNPSETLFIRVVNTVTGCINSTVTLDVNITNSNTGIIRNTQYIDACDSNHDGSATFDLTQVLTDVLNGETGFLPPTFHTSQSDAESGANPITNPQGYTNSEPDEQTVYLRLEDSTTGCYALIPIEIHTNLLLTGTNIPPLGFAFCDDDGDGSVDMYLNTMENVIANGLPNITVTFYETQNDRDNNTLPITASPYPITIPQTLYLRIENGMCTELSEVLFRVNPVVIFNNVAPIDYCDTDDDGITTIDFDSLDTTITGGNTDFSVRYFLLESDADTGINQLPQFYESSSGTFYARIENTSTSCSTVNEFEINVIPAPTVTQPNDIIICDDDQDGFSIINLENKIPEIVSDTTGLVIDFFDDYNNANSNTSPISAIDRTNYNTDTKTIYVRIQSTASSGCYTLIAFETIVNTLPIIPVINPYQVCVDQGTPVADFILANKDGEILNGQTGKDVFYYQDSSYSTHIDKTLPYTSSGSETIYIRVENITDPNCFSTSSFTIEIGSNPNYNTAFTDFPPVCQDGFNGYTFDLEAKRQEIALGTPDNLNISFYLTDIDAINNANTTLPNQYTSQELQGQFYARIENTDNSCVVIEEVRFITFASPIITLATIEPVCDADYDGIATFDLTSLYTEIDNIRFSTVSYSFFENSDLTGEITGANINNYISDSKTIYVKVENTSTFCSDWAPLDLVVNTPPATNSFGTIEICDNETNTYDLSQLNSLIVNNTNTVNISYHNSGIDANNNATPIGNTYNYTSTNHTIYIRVSDINTGCPIIIPFNLQINPNPIANRVPDMVDCDDDFDGFLDFDLTQQNNTILGTQNPANFTITYYTSLINAEEGNSPLNSIHSSFNGDIIFARIENNTTSCFDTTQFNIRVNPLPIIPIDDIVTLCSNNLPLVIDAYTGNPSDTYLWSTGATTSQILLNDVGDIGDYWVAATTPNIIGNDCSYTHLFSVIESQQAEINFTTTVDFADPNSITVDISGIGDYEYILDGGEPQTSNIFNNVTLGQHIVTIIDLNGCMPVDVPVFVIDIPKFVTPNSDGYFDTWHIVGINQLPGTVVYIYNRHGKLLKTLPHTVIGWDGTFNGENMPADDYWFVANVIKDGQDFDIRGHFALKR